METPVNILLVDDDARNLDALESILESPVYRLVRAQNAYDALQALVADDFAVIMLDIRMPEMNGLELAQIIKQRKKTMHIPIIFLTAYYQEDEHIMKGYGAGAVDYLNKPFNPGILRSKVAVYADLFRTNRALETEIAERRLAEGQVRELNKQLALRINDLRNANAELETFSYSVSHDLRAPLRQVAGFVGSLKKAATDRLDPAAAEYLPLIQDSVTRMGRLIDDLLEFSRVGRTELHQQPVALGALFERAQTLLRPATDGRVITWKIGELPEVLGDEAMLSQAMVNLVDNAIKFTRPRAAAIIEVGGETKPGEHIIYIRDNGVGFEMQQAEKLFGVFQRMHSRDEFEGMGIGLASVRRIIQRHGGRVWAESALDKGTTIYVSLPLTEITTASLQSRGGPSRWKLLDQKGTPS